MGDWPAGGSCDRSPDGCRVRSGDVSLVVVVVVVVVVVLSVVDVDVDDVSSRLRFTFVCTRLEGSRRFGGL